LFLGQVVNRHMRLDLDQIIQSDLQSTVTGARAAERFLDERPEGKNPF
jgi:hypothetical protein